MLYESYYGISDLGDSLTHHGILGQKWGKRNGPPYPLDAPDHSAREKKAGWQKSLGGISKKRVLNTYQKKKSVSTSSSKTTVKPKEKREFHLSDKQKTALKVGAGVAVAGLAIYGGYKLSKMNPDAVNSLMKNVNLPIMGKDNLPDIGQKEGILDRMSKVNPEHHADNCLLSAIAGQARLMGKDVTAESLNSGNYMQMDKAIKKCFSGAEVLTDNPSNRELASRFAKSRKDAEALLVEKFGQNASGIIGVNWTQEMGGGGHAFNFQIFNGNVVFSDYQNSFTNDHNVLNNFWKMNAIDGNKYICLAKLDGSSVKRGINKFVKAA